jgi:Family of unknown function (DUF5670)
MRTSFVLRIATAAAHPNVRLKRSVLGQLSSTQAATAAMAFSKGDNVGLIWGIVVLLVVLWLLGLVVHVGGYLIHLLLVIAVILLVFNLITGRGARV